MVFFSVPASATEKNSISNEEVKKIVEENSSSPGSIVDQKWISLDSEVNVNKIEEVQSEEIILSDQEDLPIDPGEKIAQVIDREDGKQIITISPGDTDHELRFVFKGAFLELKDGYILVRPEQFEEPEKIIDPAWAQDTDGNEVKTYFEVDGDTLIQHVGKSMNGAPVVSDPYIRDVHAWGVKIGQELVFTKDETSLAAVGTAYCAGKVRGSGLATWIVKGACTGASAVATHAANTGRCLTIRAIGGRYAPNVVFPYATRC